MPPDVNAPSTRAARTEQRIVDAARDLFVERGWRGTTLTDVAKAAGVADRTIYVRFATKADLLRRVVDVAVVGDLEPERLADRDWVSATLEAPTLDERLTTEATHAADLLARTAPVLAVAMQAEGEEPVIARAAQDARESTLRQVRTFWERLFADGLMHARADLDWVVPTAALLGNAETYVHMTRTLGWDTETYRRWRLRTWRHLATAPSPAPIE
ncbi:TetR/AcrR family transcriptional regulator [Nocardioides sediminis]|uniref:TetR/AcrR family transcriptional regulator n=1 Tax=Nocardioides sediminis TaxID=433648 RepID=UPI00131F1DD8|nr:TetR/AcrR family transcriptional regulator [Nocardioides sediminis]